MQILYCEDCGTRVDESESTLVDGKVYCGDCAPKAKAASPTAGGTRTVRRSVRRPNTPGGTPTPGRATPGGGVRNLRSDSGSSGMFTPATRSAEAGAGDAPPVPAWKAWIQRNTALAIALGAGVVGVVLALLWSAFATPPEPPKRPAPQVSTTQTVTAPTTTATVSTVVSETKPKGPGFVESGGMDIGLDSAKEAWDEIQKMPKNTNAFDRRRALKKFVDEKVRYKAQPFYQEAVKQLAAIPEALRPPDDAAGATPGLNVIAAFKDVDAIYTANYKPEKTFTFKDVNIGDANKLKELTGHDMYVALRITGFVEAPLDGPYTFYLKSDDGSHFYMGDSKLIDNGGDHAMSQEKTVTIPLQAGKHSFRIDYYQGKGLAGLTLNWSGPKLDKEPIPEKAFSSKK